MVDLLNDQDIGGGMKLWPTVATCQWEMNNNLPIIIELLNVMATIGTAVKPGNADQRFATVTMGDGCNEQSWYVIGEACNADYKKCGGKNIGTVNATTGVITYNGKETSNPAKW